MISNYSNLTMEGVLFNYTTNFKLGLAPTIRIEVAVSDFCFVNQGLRNDSTIFGGRNQEFCITQESRTWWEYRCSNRP